MDRRAEGPDHGFAGEGHPYARQGDGAAEDPPAFFLSGSAIGYYGDTDDQRITEESSAADDFAALVTIEWEKEAAPIATTRTRLAYLRTGIVLDPSGGALKEQLPFFKLGIGGRIGDGTQWFSWISLDDEVGAIIHLLENDVSGPVTSPPQPGHERRVHQGARPGARPTHPAAHTHPCALPPSRQGTRTDAPARWVARLAHRARSERLRVHRPGAEPALQRMLKG